MRWGKVVKGVRILNDGSTLWLFADNMTICIENSRRCADYWFNQGVQQAFHMQDN
jgi:hypothetical protein